MKSSKTLRGALMRSAFVVGCLGAHASAIDIAGDLLIDLDAADYTSGANWPQSTANAVPVLAGDFVPTGTPKRETISGAPAVVLDGGDEYLTGPATTAALDGPAATHSVEYWVYQGQIDREEAVVSWGHRGGNPDGSMAGFRYSSHLAWGAVARWGGPDMGFAAPHLNGPDAGNWHHIVVTYDGDNQRIYIDGELNYTEAAALNAKDGRPILVGAEWENTTTIAGDALKYSGAIGKIRIHSGVLSPEQVANNYALESAGYPTKKPALLSAGPVNRYSFNEAAAPAPDGTVVTDSIGGANGVIRGADVDFTGSGVDLDGGPSATAGYVDLPNGLISAHSDLTIELWVTQQSVNAWNRFFDFGTCSIGEVTGPGGDFNGGGLSYIGISPNKGTGADSRFERGAGVVPNGGIQRDSEGADAPDPDPNIPVFTVGQKYHIAVVYDSAEAEWRFYRDGNLMEVIPETSGPTTIADVNVWLGRGQFSGDGNLDGVFDELRIYDYPLNESQVYGNFLAGPDTISTGLTWTPTTAGPFNFDNAGSEDNWGTGAGGAFPNASGAVAAVASDLSADQTVSLNQPITLGTLVLGDPDGSNGFDIVPGASGTLTFDNDGAPANLVLNGSTTGDSISAPVALTSDTTITGLTDGDLSISGVVSGAGNLGKAGMGDLLLTADNSAYPGNIDITGGSVIVGDGGTSGALGSGAITTATGTSLTLDRSDAVDFSQSVTGGGEFHHVGTGTVTVTGSIETGGRLTVPNGTLINENVINGCNSFQIDGDVVLTGDSVTTVANYTRFGYIDGGTATIEGNAHLQIDGAGDFNVGDGGSGNSAAFITGGSSNAGTYYIGKATGTTGVVLQSAGEVIERAGGGDNRIGGGNDNAADAWGAWVITGGTLTHANNLQIGAYGTGIMEVDGGSVDVNGGFPVIGRFATGLGVLDVRSGYFNQNEAGGWRIIVGEAGYGNLNLRGTGTVDCNGGMIIGHPAGGTGVVNLETGATFSTRLITSSALGTLNFHGGLLRALEDNAGFVAGDGHLVVHSEGANIDTNGFNVASVIGLERATGDGVDAIAVTNGGSGYLAPPVIELTGGGGSGATAVAVLSGDTVSSIVITNPGVDYSSPPDVTILGGGDGSGLVLGTPSLAANSSGGLTKTGAGALTIEGSCDYEGTTTVQEGSLILNGFNADATGDINVPVGSTLGGIGTLGGQVNVDGALSPGASTGLLTVWNDVNFGATSTFVVEIDESDLLYSHDSIDVDGNIVIAPGATLQVNAIGSVSPPYVIATTTGTISGTFIAPEGVTVVYTSNSITLTAVPTGYSSWIAQFPSIPVDQQDPEDDPDGDGVPNSDEFALNGDPTDPTNNGLTALLIQDTDGSAAGDELTLVIAVRDGDGSAFAAGANGVQTATRDGYVYTVEGSLDLNFPASAVSEVGVSETAPAGSDLPDLTGTDWEYHTFRLDASEGLPGKGFLRAVIAADTP